MPDFRPQSLPERALLRMAGEGVLAFLHNLLTCDVAELPVGTWAYGALLSPQGKIQHELFVFNAGDDVLVDCVAAERAALLQKLTLYRLRAKITIVESDAQVTVSSSPLSGGAVDPRLAAIGHRAISATAITGDGEYHKARIALGLGDGGADMGSNLLFPHEANLDLLNGVNFRKGCYIGQEVVSRMQHRGTARNRIIIAAGNAPLPPRDTPITAGTTQLGTMLGAQGTQGLALIRLDRWAEATAPIETSGLTISLHKADWMTGGSTP
jgi:tRNA-modifying protein YgfZ